MYNENQNYSEADNFVMTNMLEEPAAKGVQVESSTTSTAAVQC